jgi:hypothetical protein
MGICDQWSIDPPGLHFEPPDLLVSVLGSPRKLLNFGFIADSDPNFNADPDPDTTSKNNADPDLHRLQPWKKEIVGCTVHCTAMFVLLLGGGGGASGSFRCRSVPAKQC